MPLRQSSCLPVPLCIFLLLLLLSAPFSRLQAGEMPERPARLELAVGTGYAWGGLRQGRELRAVPAFVRAGFELDRHAGPSSHRVLYGTIEPFVNPVAEPGHGVEAGIAVGLRYLHGLAGPVWLYLEGAIAPTYFSLSTPEQGAGGLNFLEHAGSGLQCRLSGTGSLFLGFRFRHLSHAGLADRSNDGINSLAVVGGIAWEP